MDRSDIKVFSDSVSIGRWHYTKPLLQPTENGEIVFILQSCFGPCKCWKWSMDAQGKFWIEYEWCENDFYKDDNFRKEISLDKMIEKMQQMQAFFADHGLHEYVTAYERAEQFIIERKG